MSSSAPARLHHQRWIVPVRVLLVLLLATGSTCGLEVVSVCRDATYDIPSDRGATICSGSDSQPHGSTCPKANDVASRDCHEHLSTFNSSSSFCVVQEDAKCQLVRDGVWGCVFLTLGCATSPTLSYDQAQLNCPTWEDASLDEKEHFLKRLDAFQSATEEDAPADDSWFSMETEPAALIACGRHPPVASSQPVSAAKQVPSTSDTIAPEPTLSPSTAPSPAVAQLLHPPLSLLAAAQQTSTLPATAVQPTPGPIVIKPTPTPTSSPISPPPTPVPPAIASPTWTPASVSSTPSLVIPTPTPTPNSTKQIPTQTLSTPRSTPTTAKPPMSSVPTTPVPLPHTAPCPSTLTPSSSAPQLIAPCLSTPASGLASLSPPSSTPNHTAPCPPAPSPTTSSPPNSGESTSLFRASASPCPPTTELSTLPSVTPCPSSLHLHAHSSPAPLPPVASTPSTISQLQFSTQGRDSEQHSSAGIEAPASQSTATPSAIRVASISQITAIASEDDDVLGEGTASTAAAAATPTDSVELIVVVACGAAVAIAVAVFAGYKLRRFVRHDRLLRRKAGSTLATPVTVRSKFISAS